MKEDVFCYQEYAKDYTNDILVVSHGSAIETLIKGLKTLLIIEFLNIENLSLTIINSTNLNQVAWNLDHNQSLDCLLHN